MNQAAQWINNHEYDAPEARRSGRLSFLKFLLRYPIFLLAFGPPIFRAPIVGTDTSQAHFDMWNILQVGWISLVALRAILRLTAAEKILIPKQVRSVLTYAMLLGLLFLISVTYSPGRVISTEYSILYFLTLICMIEFIVDVHRAPPNWVQCLFHLRLIGLLLIVLALLTLSFAPSLVVSVVPGAGIRLGGGVVAPLPVIFPIVAIISAYSFLYSLEPRVRSTSFFILGLIGTAIAQTRGAEIALFLTLAILGIGWVKYSSKRSAYLFISGFMATTLLAGVLVGAIGGESIWRTFNRGQDMGDIASASGRTEMWKFAIQYCLTHPQGMGYIAGFRALFTTSFSLNLGANVAKLGTTHNAFIDILADAGWLALAVYSIMMFKVLALGWRSAKKRTPVTLGSDDASRHAIRCFLLLFCYCMMEGMENSVFCIPLQGPFYYQNLIIAVILGASATMVASSRSQHAPFVR